MEKRSFYLKNIFYERIFPSPNNTYKAFSMDTILKFAAKWGTTKNKLVINTSKSQYNFFTY